MSRFCSNFFGNTVMRTTVAISCALLLPLASTTALADSYSYDQAAAAPMGVAQNLPPALAPDQLDNLVAPIALYPDPLLGQILAASTYPLEVVEAWQWLQQNRNLQGELLVEAARQQGWDPSVVMLVAFPDVMAMLNRDVRWTTDLGNAFLTQQADVMNAIQTLRIEARNNGRLATTPQQVVTTDAQNGQYAVQIEPANPQVIYPPIYNPAYVWGPPAYGAYPAVSYAPAGYGGYGYGGYGSNGFGFGSGINIAGLFSGVLSWGGWGWVLGWFTHSLSLASLFFNILGFHGFGGGGGGYGAVGFAGGLALWVHNPEHRLGIPYPRGFVAARNAGVMAGGRVGSSRLLASTTGVSASRVLAGTNNRVGSEPMQRFAPSSSAAARGIEPTQNRAPVNDYRGVASSYRPGATSYTGYAGSAQSHRAPSSVAPQQRMASTGYQSNGYQGNAFRGTDMSARSAMPQASSQRYSAQASQAQQRYSAPRMSASNSQPKFSEPKFSAPKAQKFSEPKAPKFSAPKAPKNSGGGHSGKSSHKH